jgi:hypothetical protein
MARAENKGELMYQHPRWLRGIDVSPRPANQGTADRSKHRIRLSNSLSSIFLLDEHEPQTKVKGYVLIRTRKVIRVTRVTLAEDADAMSPIFSSFASGRLAGSSLLH